MTPRVQVTSAKAALVAAACDGHDGQIGNRESGAAGWGPNSAPSCEITSPADETGVSLGESVNFRGLATDPDVSSNQLTYIWKSDKDGDLGTGNIFSDGSIYFSYDALTAATHAISLEVSDEVGEQCTDIIFLSVGTAPTLTSSQRRCQELRLRWGDLFFEGTLQDNDELSTALVCLGCRA